MMHAVLFKPIKSPILNIPKITGLHPKRRPSRIGFASSAIEDKFTKYFQRDDDEKY